MMSDPKVEIIVEETIKLKTAGISDAGILDAGMVIDGKYEIISHIGSGGMGEVYKVFDSGTKNYYALKILAPELASQKLMSKRLENEARAARTLAHGNIVSVYEVGESGGAPYLVMDFIEGESLDQLLKTEGYLSQERALPLFIQMAEALVHARQKSVLHRDLKPSNILISKTPGGNELIKIVDFGIAKVNDQQSADKTKLTQTGELLGTPLYMSPEQCRGEDLDGRSDIYSFGCIMFEVLTGKAAFAADNQVLVILKHLSDQRPTLPTGVGISSDMKAVINRCLEKDKSDRYDNAVTLQIDLERIQNERPIQKHHRRFRFNSKIGKVLAAATLGLGAVMFLRAQFATQPQANTAAPAVISAVSQPAPAQPRAETYKGKTLAQWTNDIENSPEDPQLYFARAELHASRDERTNAIDDLSQAIKLKPNYIQAYCERCVQNVLLANYDKAEQDAKKAIELDPDSPEGYESLGWVYNSREQYDEALATWNKAISIADRGYYHYSRSQVLLRLGRLNEAESDIRKGLQLDSEYDNISYHGVAGVIATFKQDYQYALEELKLATSGKHSRGVEWQELAYYYVCTGQMAEAEQAIERAKAMETFPARAYRLAGELYRTAAQYDKALQQFSASTSLEEYPPGYRERAVVNIDTGHWRAAYEDLKKSIQLNPKSILTLSYLAAVESHLGMKKAADEHIVAAFNAKSIPPLVYLNRASLKLDQGDQKAALDDTNKALAQDPFLKEGYLLRSALQQKAGNASAAADDKKKAASLVSHLDL